MIFLIESERSQTLIDSKGPYTFMVQKHDKEIDKIIHVTSGVRNLMKLQEYFLFFSAGRII